MKDQRMLLRVGLESFKSIAQLEQELAQLTVVVGENSAGKSSLLQSIVTMSQIARSDAVGSDVPLHGNELDLGDFKDVVHAGAAADEVTVSLTIRELPLADQEIGQDVLDELRTPEVGEFRWDVSMGPPFLRHRGASIRRLTLHSSITRDTLSASPVDPRSEDPGEQSRASDLRLLLARSIRLARAAGDPGLELAARSAFGSTDSPIFAGGVRLQQQGEDQRLAEAETRLHYVEVAGGLPTLALRAVGNKRKSAEAFLALSNTSLGLVLGDADGGESGVPTRGENGEDPDDYLDENIVTAFAQWYEALDEALRERESFALPETHFELDPASFREHRDLAQTAKWLAEIDLPEVIERDQLERFESGVVAAAELVQDALTRRVRLLGPLRDDPSPTYQSGALGSGITPLGKKGQHTVAFLDEHGSDPVACPLLPDDDQPGRFLHDERSLKSAVDYWLQKLGIAERSRLAPLGRSLEFDLVDPQTHARQDLTGVGVGASQILPVLVLCLAAKPGDLLLLEQPELHLHPKPQQILGDFLLGIASTGRQLLVETHSEYLVNRLRLRMVEQRLDEHPASLKLLYAIRDRGATTFNELRPNALGAFEGGWPEGFFDQSPQESEQIVRAAARRRRADRAVAE